MATTYGSFPGVRVNVAGGGITAVAIGEAEKLVLFGAANYTNDGGDTDLSTLPDGSTDAIDGAASSEEPVQINARREADNNFGEESALADAMREALANGANLNYLYAVAPERVNAIGEVSSTQTGTLANFPLFEEDVDNEANIENIEVEDTTGPVDMTVTFSYDGTPSTPSAADTIAINPLTGEFAADATPDGDYEFNYKYLNWDGAFGATAVQQILNEDETGVYDILTDSDAVSADLDSEVSTLRQDYKLVNALSGAEPNDNQIVTTDGEPLESDYSNYRRTDARYNTSDYANANQSIDSDYHFKMAPVRVEDEKRTALGGIGGLFAGNSINDPIYNDPLSGYQALEQSLSKTDADNLREENVIPIRQAGSIRVKDNLSTSTETDWERDFWRRRIADRVILIGKTIGDAIIGQINDEGTRNSAERLIRQELRELVGDRLLKPNTQEETNWFVDVYEDSTNPNQVNIDIGFTPYGIVKRVEETITINT